MMRRTRSHLFLSLSIALAGLVLGRSIIGPPQSSQAQLAAPAPERVVYLAGTLADEDLIVLAAMTAAGDKTATVLLDSSKLNSANRDFLSALKPTRVMPVGDFPQGFADLDRRLGVSTAPAQQWSRGPPEQFWQRLYTQAPRVVVAPPEPRSLLLQSAVLAGSLRAPLLVWKDDPKRLEDWRRSLTGWRTREVLAVGKTATLLRDMADAAITPLKDEDAVQALYLKELWREGPIQTLVIANPADSQAGHANMAWLSAGLAVRKRAALLCTNDAGDNANALIQAACKKTELRSASNLILVASLKAIPMDRRANPLEGKDAFIDMEPMTPAGEQPFSFATGRMFHAEPAGVALLVGRSQLLAEGRGPRKALVVSNPGGGLPLLETISRNTAQELRNAGYQTTTMFRDQANKDQLRKLLPEQHVFLWEGHHKTLVADYELPKWTEPLPGTLIFLQSCLALNEEEVQPLLNRGASGIIGSSTRTYSGSGGAFSLAFFDALAYDRQTLGGSLRHAKNFLLAYSILKEKRLGEQAKLGGANLRSSWAFSLWGDPTVQLPPLEAPANALPAVRGRVVKDTFILSIPEKAHEKVTVDKYEVQMLPNARLAGLLTKTDDVADNRSLIPLLFAEVALPDAPFGKTPTLRGKLNENRWVFCWDAWGKRGYLLVMPRASDQKEIRFQIEWQAAAGPMASELLPAPDKKP
jgi:hypothetical protein